MPTSRTANYGSDSLLKISHAAPAAALPAPAPLAPAATLAAPAPPASHEGDPRWRPYFFKLQATMLTDKRLEDRRLDDDDDDDDDDDASTMCVDAYLRRPMMACGRWHASSA